MTYRELIEKENPLNGVLVEVVLLPREVARNMLSFRHEQKGAFPSEEEHGSMCECHPVGEPNSIWFLCPYHAGYYQAWLDATQEDANESE